MSAIFFRRTNWNKHRRSHEKFSVKEGVIKNFRKFHTKTPALKSLFYKVEGLLPCNFIKKRLSTGVFSCEICKTFKNTYF